MLVWALAAFPANSPFTIANGSLNQLPSFIEALLYKCWSWAFPANSPLTCSYDDARTNSNIYIGPRVYSCLDVLGTSKQEQTLGPKCWNWFSHHHTNIPLPMASCDQRTKGSPFPTYNSTSTSSSSSSISITVCKVKRVF